jgi:hypothetical protein
MPLETRYITVDLIAKGDGETAQLIAALEAMDYVVQKHEWDEIHEWYLKVGCARDFDEPEPCILKYCEDLETLPLGPKANGTRRT